MTQMVLFSSEYELVVQVDLVSRNAKALEARFGGNAAIEV